MERARENGDAARFDEIGDYVLSDSLEKGKLCSYEFDMLPIVNFGGSEGIYIDCSLRGKFDNSGRNSLHIGTLKTLDTGLDACKTMSARYGTGGNNVPLVSQEADTFCIAGNIIDRQVKNGGNGLGCQPDISYTLTGMDHLSGHPDK